MMFRVPLTAYFLSSQVCYTRANSSSPKQSTLVRGQLSTYFFFIAKATQRVVSEDFRNKLCLFQSLCSQGICTRAKVDFGNKLGWFESRCRHISLCS